MNTALAIFTMCFSFLYLIEGIDISIRKKTNMAYKISHILFPLLMVGTMIYFLTAGVITD